MANSEHLAKLKQGVATWNAWRDMLAVIPDLSGTDLSDEDLSSANLSDADLSGTKLIFANLDSANLDRANLNRASLVSANLFSAYLRLADLRGAVLDWADLRLAHLHQAKLRDAGLHGVKLNNAFLAMADLRRAELREAILIGTNLESANLSDARIGATIFDGTDLSSVKGLEVVQHHGPSTIGIDTIYLSHGNIPLAFLRGAGVPENFIEYMGSLTGKTLEFYSCFISYSTKDQEFADRLHADLQNKGVRCWFAPHDLKIGDRFQEVIEQSIRVYEKLLLILSENSVNSHWVEREVQAAMEKERRSPGDTMLFPIRLDDAVMESNRAWAASIRRTRQIGDFRKWKDHDSSKSAFERLLSDLKTKDPKTA